ncbi:MAG: type II toxin-antitoxin system prevent-host-death family antitoxin [Candidatus Hydrogenedentes bacterium]|nr:type II toxin-antitoxin system prevent-host-death family antitoxin [Candidatus Hydrogenedentota bacterium]
MDSITYAEAHSHLAEAMGRVCDDHVPLMIARQDGDSIVMVSRVDYESLEETAYLLRSPANASRLAASLTGIEPGNSELD